MSSNTNFGTISVNGVKVSVNAQNPQRVRNVGYVPPTDYLASVFGQANAAYAAANASYTTSNSAITTANAALDLSHAAFNTANASIQTADSSSIRANIAYRTGNAAYGHANAAYDTANLKLNIAGGTITGDLSISGNLAVEGVTLTANTQVIVFEDNIITLNSNVSGTPTANAGIEINRGNQHNVSLLWTESEKSWEFTNNGLNFEKIASLDYANAAYATGNAAYATVNSAFQQANASYATGNAAYATANASYATGNAAYATVNSAFEQANSSYAYANTLVRRAGDTMTGNLAFVINSVGSPVNAITVSNTDGLNFVLSNAGDMSVYGQANVRQKFAVGEGAYFVLPNLIAQFTANAETYSQVNQQNLNANGSGDLVVTADNGTDTTHYSDLGKAGSNYNYYGPTGLIKPNDTYLIGQGSDDSIIGSNVLIMATTAGAGDIVFAQGGAYEENEIARFKYGQGLIIETKNESTSNSTGSLVVQGGVGVQGALNADTVYDNGTRIVHVAQSGHDVANIAYQTGYYANTAWNQANSAYAEANAISLGSNNYTDYVLTANIESSNLRSDSNISSNVANLRFEITDNVTTINVQIDSVFGQANASYDTANASYATVNSAFEQANAGYATANASYETGNAAYATANAAYDTANAGYATANASYETGNAAYATANASYVTVNSAFEQVNSAFEQANASYATGNAAYVTANAAYVTVNSAFEQANASYATGNAAYATVNSAFEQANASYATANAAYVTVNSAFEQVNSSFAQANASYATGNAAYVTANAAYVTVNSAFEQANAAYATANASYVTVNSAFEQANASYAHTNASFNLANTALQNTTGVFAGSLELTGNVAVDGHLSVGEYVDFNTGISAPTHNEGRVFYDNDQKALAYYNESAMTGQLLQESVVRVWNNTASVITDGKAVYVSGQSSVNNFPSIALAGASTYDTSEVIGITTTTIDVGGYGYVTTKGKVNGLDTSLYTEGDEIYLADTGGTFVGAAPATPSVAVRLGTVVHVDAIEGQVLVDISFREGVNMTTGSLVFAYNEHLYEDPENLYWDYGQNRLGIGTNTPQANLHVVGSGLFTGNVIISGNLLVSNAQSITTTELTVGGNTVVLNSELVGTPTSNAEIIVNRGTENNVFIRWDESIKEWTMFEDATYVGHILHHRKTATTWDEFNAQAPYERLRYPVGGRLTNNVSEHAIAGYTTANTAFATGYYANTAWNQANASYAQGNTTILNTNSYITSNVLTINTSIDANVATLRGEITANADSANSIINTRISANIATANLFTQAAFDLANTSVQRSGDTMTGSLSVNDTTQSTSNSTGALKVAGGLGVTGNVFVGDGSVIGYSVGAGTPKVYQVYNAATNSLDTYFV